MKISRLYLLLLTALPFSVSAGAIYTYTGLPMTCKDTCVPGTYAISATLAFTGTLAPSTQYVNDRYDGTWGPVPGATNVAGLLTTWSISAGTFSISSALPVEYSLYLQTDTTGAIASWYLASQSFPSATEMLLLGTTSAADMAIYQSPETSWWESDTPGTWTADAGSAVPEPSTMLLAAVPLGLIVLFRRRLSGQRAVRSQHRGRPDAHASARACRDNA
jgi:hypothetical protein